MTIKEFRQEIKEEISLEKYHLRINAKGAKEKLNPDQLLNNEKYGSYCEGMIMAYNECLRMLKEHIVGD